MTISRSDWKAYVDRLALINRRAGELMQQYLDLNGYEDTQQLLGYAYALVTKYGGASSALACEMYDALALSQGVTLPAAEPAETADFGEVAKAVRGTMKNERNSVPDTVSRLVKQAGADTSVQNAIRDGAEWAWIPSGDTCAFCLTLASRGWQRASKKTLKGDHAEHIHAHCNCEFAIRFDGKSTVAGYDQEAYRAAYYNAEGSTPKEKVNALRRDWYAKNKDRVNEQKRAAYKVRVEERGKGPITKITDKAIERVQAVESAEYTAEESKTIQRLHKELLKEARDGNNGNETAFVLSSDFSRKEVIKGSETEISFGDPLLGNNMFIMHNHPRNSSFSSQDVQVFLKMTRLKSLSIAKNNGGVELLTKTGIYDTLQAKTIYTRAMRGIGENTTEKEVDKAVKSVLRKLEKMGMIEWKSTL